MDKKRIGIYGGSFDPIHNGHIGVAEKLLELGLVDEVYLMIAYTNPFKDKCMDFATRVEMAKMAVANNTKISVITIEESLGAPSRTFNSINTLECLIGGNDCEFHIIFGADTWNTIEKFYCHELIVNNYPIIVVSRPGYKPNTKYDNLENVKFVEIEPSTISSTLVRENLANGKSIVGMVPEDVRAFIYSSWLYTPNTCQDIVNELFSLLKKSKLTVSTAESCTGGLISSTLTSVPGSSEFVHGGVVTYNNDMKIKLLGVKKETIDKHTEVSTQTAIEMATGACELMKTDCAISVTGYASNHDESGKIFVCATYKKDGEFFSLCENLDTRICDRCINKKIATRRGISMLIELLKKMS